MPKYLINITEAAEKELIDALKVADEIEESIAQLEDFPLSGATPKNRRLARQGYRMLVVGSYLVFYVVLEDETVEIRRILSGSREYRFLL